MSPTLFSFDLGGYELSRHTYGVLVALGFALDGRELELPITCQAFAFHAFAQNTTGTPPGHCGYCSIFPASEG